MIKNIKSLVVKELLTQVNKTIPDAKKSDLWKIGLFTAMIGCLLMQVPIFSNGFRCYAAAMFVCGIGMSLLTFVKEDEQ